MGRINMPILDETPRLLRATTRVALVHQATLVVHEVVKVSACAGKALAEVVSSHIQDFCSNRVTGTENLGQGEDQSLPAIQTKQHAHGAAVFGFFDQERYFN